MGTRENESHRNMFDSLKSRHYHTVTQIRKTFNLPKNTILRKQIISGD